MQIIKIKYGDYAQDTESGLSSYNYSGNNPIMRTDPTGREIEDVDGTYSTHKNEIQTRVSTIEEGIKNGLYTKDLLTQAKSQLKEYNKILKEYSKLEKSKTVYSVSTNANLESGGVTSMKNEVVIIEISPVGVTDGLVGHELKHAYQYEMGQLSFDFATGLAGTLYDLGDEVAAFNRQSFIDFGEGNKYTESSVRADGSYSTLSSRSKSMNSGFGAFGRPLRKAMYNYGATRGTSVPIDMYKGAEDDYNRGLRKR